MLHEVTAQLRPRTGWESQDLGLAMVRSMIGRLIGHWCAVLVPIWAILFVLLWNYPTLLGFVVWWLKPVYDRLPLFALGRKLFGQDTTLKDVLREAPQLLFKGNLYFLTLGRFSFYRAVSLPVKILESSPYSAYRRRAGVLLAQNGSTVFGISLSWLIITVLGVAGLYLFIETWNPLRDPEVIKEMWSNFFGSKYISDDPATLRYGCLLFLVMTTLTEIFYIGSGFGLYLNSRSHLEGWDIEVSFRALANRLRESAAPIIIFIGILLSPMAASTASAKSPSDSSEPKRRIVLPPQSLDEAEDTNAFDSGENVEEIAPETQEEVEKLVSEIKGHADFTVHTKTHTVYDPAPSSSKKKQDLVMPSFQAFAGLSQFFTWTLIIIAAGLLGWLIYANRHGFAWRRGPRTEDKPSTTRVVLGMDVSPETLPADIPSAAWQQWLAGDAHAAVRILYAGSLSWMIQPGGLPIRESDTEGDCLSHSSRLQLEQRQYFKFLTTIWTRIAYGKRTPQTDEIEQCVQSWPFPK